MSADDTADARRLWMIVELQPPFARLMGAKIVEATRDRVVAEVFVREELANRNGRLHGGAVMAIADNLDGTATFLNMPEGAGTTTIESKTNFFAAVPLGDTLRAECTPLHRGRTTMVWQTRITRSDGRLAGKLKASTLAHPPGRIHLDPLFYATWRVKSEAPTRYTLPACGESKRGGQRSALFCPSSKSSAVIEKL
jgi:uncharacterized protein (TIGR00369 family)